MAVISGDSMFSHAMLRAKDRDAPVKFDDAALAPLGVRNPGPFGDGWMLCGRDRPAFPVVRPGDGEESGSGGVTIGFAAATTDAVRAFHAANLAAGETDEGAPGPRTHLPGACAAYRRDPGGNRICAYTVTDGY